MEVLCFSTLPQLFFLQKARPCLRMCRYKEEKKTETIPAYPAFGCHRRVNQQQTPPKEESLKYKSDPATPRPL